MKIFNDTTRVPRCGICDAVLLPVKKRWSLHYTFDPETFDKKLNQWMPIRVYDQTPLVVHLRKSHSCVRIILNSWIDDPKTRGQVYIDLIHQGFTPPQIRAISAVILSTPRQSGK